MSLTLNLSPETEQKLRERAAQQGQSCEKFIEHLVERTVSGQNGSTNCVREPLPSDSALAPFRQEVKESGMTDDQLLELFDEVREEIYLEKQGRSGRDS